MKSWFKYILMAVLYGAFTTSCAPEDDLVSALYDKSYVTLSRVVIPLDNNDNTKEHITVESVRVLIFDGISGNIISNTLVSGENNISGSYDASHNAYIISLNNTAIAAYAGSHDVYVVLNENAFGANLGLGSVTTKTGMDDIKNQPVPYNTIMAVPAGNEPLFLMCTYDRVNIPSGSTATNPFVINMTGLDNGDYAFSMRRSMAKIVLESVSGGKNPDGTVLGNNALIQTSAIHILDMELINIPNRITWNDDKSHTKTPYTGDYLYPASGTNGFDLGVSPNGSNTAKGYYERVWPGNITVSGDVTFSRTDALATLWKQQENSGGNSYALTPAYIFSYSYASNSDNYDLNLGNFANFYFNDYIANGNYVPGNYVPEEWTLNDVQITPAVWSLNMENNAYYIPENITTNESLKTAIRIKASIATPTAYFTNEEINDIIDLAIKNNDYNGGIVDDGGGIIKVDNKKALASFLITEGKEIADPNGSGLYGIGYEGLKSIFRATTNVTHKKGYYAKITENEVPAKVVTITIPLTNNDGKGGGLDDHNIYRGHEYRVKLYVTKSRDEWGRSANPASRTINIGGEELTITGKVTASPIK